MVKLISLIYIFIISISFYLPKEEPEIIDEFEMFNFIRDRIEWMESGHRHFWKSGDLKIGPDGEIGIRQMTMETAEWINIKFNLPGAAGDISNKQTNIIYSDLFIIWIRTNGDGRPWPEVVSAYNIGPNTPAINVQYMGCVMGNTNYLRGKKIIGYRDDNPIYNHGTK